MASAARARALTFDWPRYHASLIAVVEELTCRQADAPKSAKPEDGLIVMDELYFVVATGTVIVLYFFAHVIKGKFDPFAPVWLFLVGYIQPYIVQATSYHEWAIGLRGKELVAAANFQALWALVWFLLVYQLGIGRKLASWLPQPPRRWSAVHVAVISPPLIVWGLFCAGMLARGGGDDETMSAEVSLIHAFPFVMMVSAVMLIVTGRMIHGARPQFLPAGLLVSGLYVLIWMFNGKRSHSLIAVLATVCAYYCTRLKRPSWPVLIATAFSGALVVAVAIGWRGNPNYERSFSGFFQFVGDFRVSKILQSINLTDDDSGEEITSYETSEYGGYLLIMDTVPSKSGHDYGANYLRVFSTFIPRIVWPTKPIFGREQWINAWIAGSELKRDEDFTGPAIGILGAAQLNGGAIGTLILLASLAVLLRTAYEFFLLHAELPWTQFWWSITYYNAWFMVVGDDPLAWFYYNWGFTCFPIVITMWLINRGGSSVTQGDIVAAPA